MEFRILNEDEVRKALGYKETIEAVEKCFADFSSGKVILPGVINLDIERYQGEVHVKSAYIKDEPYFAVKVASGFYQNRDLGLPVGNGLILLYQAKTGLLQCLMLDNGYITEMRTGAAGAVAAKHLARKQIKKVGMIGSGSQARFQLKALMEVRKPEEVWVWSRSRDHAQAYIEEMALLFPLRFTATGSIEEVVRESDLLVTVTPSRSPLVKAEWLSPGVHITAVGSDGPEKQELEADVLKMADRIFCDSIDQCSRLGEVHHALESKVIDESRIFGELGEVVTGAKKGRTDHDEVTVADLTGIGAQDTASAILVYNKAVEMGLGSTLKI